MTASNGPIEAGRSVIDSARIRALSRGAPVPGRYVLYWMQQSQRVRSNHALEYAAERANGLGLPLVVFFGVTSGFPDANLRHYRFMLEGLVETARDIEARGAAFVLRICDPLDPGAAAAEAARNAALCVVDRGYLRIQREWRSTFAGSIACPCFEVESNVIVPVEAASDHEEYSAATLRRKLHRLLPRFLVPVPVVTIERTVAAAGLDVSSFAPPGTPVLTFPPGPAQGVEPSTVHASSEIETIKAIEGALDLDTGVGPVDGVHGGSSTAALQLNRFVDERLPDYARLRNEPSVEAQTGLSPYLHFGQISALEIALRVLEDEAAQDRFAVGSEDEPVYDPGLLSESASGLLEELIVRRELSMNFVTFCGEYDRLGFLSDWARKTIDDHRRDERPTVYGRAALEGARTHDPYWNAAQREMVARGKMHGYMRMYWAKKIFEWSATPEEAYETTITFNNRYFIDGRDANGYAGVAWCYGKHDRPWVERPIFGKLRYMNARGLERKFAIRDYVMRIEELFGPTR